MNENELWKYNANTKELLLAWYLRQYITYG